MDDLEIVKGVLKNTAVITRKTNFTYIDRLFSDFEGHREILLICKKILSPTAGSHHEISEYKADVSEEATDPDITGSPLHYSFGEDTFNISIAAETRNWSKDEENHLPLSRFEASTILNLCLEKLVKKEIAPLFVLCDTLDKEKTILLGTFVNSGWFFTTKVCALGLVGLSKIHDCSSLMREHLELSSVPEREIKVTILSTYELHGVNKTMVDWTENKRLNFEGYLSLELTWNSLSFQPPIRTTSNYLIAQIAAGWKGSPLHEMWDQLLLLDKYLTILETYRKKNLSSRYSVVPLKFPVDFRTPCAKNSGNVIEKLNLMLSGDDAFDDDYYYERKDERPLVNQNDLDDNMLLSSYLKELSTRQNLDFTDKLWQLVIGSNDYAQMTDCIHAVFEDIVYNHYKPQVSEEESTLLSKLISELNTQKSTVPSLAGSLPLELVIDMGMEKMRRDYTYLLLSANLVDVNDMKEKLARFSQEDFNCDKYRKRLLTMAQIHICLEFLLLVQKLDCSVNMSYSLFDRALKLYTSDESPVKSFADLIDNPIYTLKAPGSNAMIKEVAKTSPSVWRGTLSSSQKASKFTTTTHYSLVPIFPPNIYSPDDWNENEQHFHGSSVSSCSYKIR